MCEFNHLQIRKIVSFFGPLPFISDTRLDGILVCQDTLLWLSWSDIHDMLLESDSLFFVTKLNSKMIPQSSTMVIILQDYLVLVQSFTNMQLIFAKRTTNQAAHVLAKLANTPRIYNE